MLTDKQSLILCAIIGFGFVVAGIFGILYNFAILGLLVFGLLVLIANIILTIRSETENPLESEKSDTDT